MSLQDQLHRLERRFLEIESLLAQPEVAANPQEFRRLSKEHSDLADGVKLYQEYRTLLRDAEGARAILDESSGEMAELARVELEELKAARSVLEERITLELLPKDPNDSRNVILEVRAGAGGDEASLFAAELFRAYMRYADGNRWRTELLSLSENELGGSKEVVALITGENVYRSLKFESGVHRVQRVPQTETQGRTHTSTITVAILPEADDVEVSINENDLRIDTFRAGGAGGQHVNRTDSAVRITHLPSGIVVACQDERSQIKNRAKAMKVLKARLLERAQIEQDKVLADERKLQVGRGDRSERMRTYNFPQSRITDHRINFTTHAIDAFMQGHMQELLDALHSHHQTDLLKIQAFSDL